MKNTSLRSWLGIPRWIVVVVAIAIATTPLIKVSTVQPLEIKLIVGK